MFDIEYKGKLYNVVRIISTYNHYYLVVRLEPHNLDAFVNILNKITLYNEHKFKDSYKGMSGIVPFEFIEREDGLFGKFKLDMWMPDENWEKREWGEI